LERDIFIDASDPALDPVFRLLGTDTFDSEELIAYELGHRWRASETLHIDLALFENHYDGLASLELGTPFVDPNTGQTIIPISNRNLSKGRTRGAEILVSYSPMERWRLSASYSYLEVSIDPSGMDINRGRFYEGASPRHQFALGSYLTLGRGVELDLHFRHVGALEELPEDPSGAGIPAYSEIDLRLSWQVSKQLRASLVGQSLLNDHHIEFGTPAARGAIQRGVYLKLAWDL
jgi:iron complex outermembrane receptor protein